MSHNFKFEFTPSLIILLGEQLIHDKKIALSELAKNAYDADATFVEIDVGDEEIIITDDGCGMNVDIIKNVWLKPGISYKKSAIRDKKLSPRFKRLPIGEKGVGRLGCHKLGSRIELYSKQEGSKEVYFSIDWEEIANAESLEELAPIVVSENKEPKYFKNKTGTKMFIRALKEKWTTEDIKKISNDLFGFISPFSNEGLFDVVLKSNGEVSSNNLKEQVEDIKKKALYFFKVVFDNEGIVDFSYEFRTAESLNKAEPREVNLKKNRSQLEKLFINRKSEINLNTVFKDDNDLKKQLQMGEVIFEGYIYDLENNLLNKIFNSTEKRAFKAYLKNASGIRVYRDGLRVFNYGEKGADDIVELDLQRVQRMSGNISSNQILGGISLDRKTSTGLVEKTNREGFLHNETFEGLSYCLKRIMKVVNILKSEDKYKIRTHYLTGPSNRAGIEERIIKVKDIVSKSNLEDQEKNQINKHIDSFGREFEETKNIFLQASATGLNLTFIIHEIDKIIDFLEENIKEGSLNKITNTFEYLTNTIDSYKETIRFEKKFSALKVWDIIEKALFISQFRFKTHHIDVTRDIDETIDIKVKRNFFIGALNNIFDNSIYWLDKYNIKNKKIFIRAYSSKDFICLVVADNGKGFNISFESSLEPFITGRSDESGMGIGLHLARVIMETHKGFIEQGDYAEDGLPEEFAEGAIIRLRLPK